MDLYVFEKQKNASLRHLHVVLNLYLNPNSKFSKNCATYATCYAITAENILKWNS